MNEREIGYVCGRGHYVFVGDEEYGTCGTKRIAGIFVRKDQDVEFYEPYDDTGENGLVWFSSCGYSEQDYANDLDAAHDSLMCGLEELRKS